MNNPIEDSNEFDIIPQGVLDQISQEGGDVNSILCPYGPMIVKVAYDLSSDRWCAVVMTYQEIPRTRLYAEDEMGAKLLARRHTDELKEKGIYHKVAIDG